MADEEAADPDLPLEPIPPEPVPDSVLRQLPQRSWEDIKGWI